ncbi:ABC transporter permease [Blastococcus sp. SYSU DS1024]
MIAVLARRTGAVLATVVLASIAVFMLMALVPGDAAAVLAGEDASVERIEELREELGLNEPLPVRYLDWAGGVLQGDLGTSILTREPVMDSILRTLPRTMELVAAGLLVAVALGVPMGILAAVKARSRIDDGARLIATLGLAVPNFWLGIVLVAIFALGLGWLPATGFVSVTEDPLLALQHLALPALAIGLSGMSAIMRQTRSAMLETMSTDYVRTLRAMGLKERVVLGQHALRNASIPVVTIVGLDINRAVGAAVVIEAVFGVAGLGTLVVQGVTSRDFPVVQGVILTVVLLIVITNFIVDVIYTMLDPRMKEVPA